MRILVIEDEPLMAAILQEGLEEARFVVETALDGEEGLRRAIEGDYSLLILDLMLPGRDGLSICRELRERRRALPILMLTARDAVRDRVLGFEMGADDYLPKPFAFPELLARVRALLRRDRLHRTRVIRIDDLVIDTAARRVTRAGREIALTDREYTLLEALAAHEGRILSREMIQERVWEDEESVSNTVEVYIAALRKKVDAGHPVRLIHTVYRAGYTLRGPGAGAGE
jgi:two-component system, OmpR family, copper resistance phosphate regulon response regulator CusR